MVIFLVYRFILFYRLSIAENENENKNQYQISFDNT